MQEDVSSGAAEEGVILIGSVETSRGGVRQMMTASQVRRHSLWLFKIIIENNYITTLNNVKDIKV